MKKEKTAKPHAPVLHRDAYLLILESEESHTAGDYWIGNTPITTVKIVIRTREILYQTNRCLSLNVADTVTCL